MRYTLLSDGSSDTVLIPVLDWCLGGLTDLAFKSQWADLRRLPDPPISLAGRIAAALWMYPCDLLFVHRDAERDAPQVRREEIRDALSGRAEPPAVCVIPVRMQEAWMLFSVTAIRQAAGCPNGRNLLEMPRWRSVEALHDPKETLHALLREASGLKGRRLRQFNVYRAAHDVASFAGDFSPLRELPAFNAFEDDLRHVLDEQGWGGRAS